MKQTGKGLESSVKGVRLKNELWGKLAKVAERNSRRLNDFIQFSLNAICDGDEKTIKEIINRKK